MADDENTEGTGAVPAAEVQPSADGVAAGIDPSDGAASSPAAASDEPTADEIGASIDEAVADGPELPAVEADVAAETLTPEEIGADIDEAVEEAAPAAQAAAAAPEPVEEPSARAPRGTKAARPAAGPKRPKTTAERGPYTRTEKEDVDQGVRRERRGVVTSDKGDKTITVRVDVMKQHPKYKKIMRRSISLRVHDEANAAHVGDTVRVVEARPMSRTKRWRLIEVVEVAR